METPSQQPSPRKVRLVIAALVLANCLPWLAYRWCGLGIEWPTEGDVPTGQWEQNYIFNAYSEVRSGRCPELFVTSNHYYFLTFFYVLPRAQIALFAVWVVFGGKPVSWRLAYVVAVVGVLTRMHLAEPIDVSWCAAKQLCLQPRLAIAVFAIGLLVPARLLDIRIRQLSGLGENDDNRSVANRFSLRYLLWLTAGFAVLFALLNRMLTDNELYCWPRIWWYFKACYVGLAIPVPAILWLSLGRRWLIVRVLVFCLSIPTCAFLMELGMRLNYSMPPVSITYRQWFDFMLQYLPSSLWIAATLWGFRYLGYGLVVRGRVVL